MIEPTDEMIYAFAGEPEITATDAHAIRVGLAAVLAIVERDYVIGPPRVTPIDPGAPVHIIAGGATTACCGRTMFELPHDHRCTLNPELRTCPGPSVTRTGD